MLRRSINQFLALRRQAIGWMEMSAPRFIGVSTLVFAAGYGSVPPVFHRFGLMQHESAAGNVVEGLFVGVFVGWAMWVGVARRARPS